MSQKLPGQIGFIPLPDIQLYIVAEPSEKAASQILLYMAPTCTASACAQFYPALVEAINGGLEKISFPPLSIDNPQPGEAAEVYSSKTYTPKSQMVNELGIMLEGIGKARGRQDILSTSEMRAMFHTIERLPWKGPQGPESGTAPTRQPNPVKPTPRGPIVARERKPGPSEKSEQPAEARGIILK